MDQVTFSVSGKREVGDILLCGFKNHPEFVHYLLHQDLSYELSTIEQVDLGYWTKKSTRNNAPYAIFFDVALLLEEDFALLRYLRQHAAFRQTAIIAFYAETKPEKQQLGCLLQHGLDDCFSIHTAWEVLEERIAFIQEIKKQQALLSPPVRTKKMKWSSYRGKRLFDILFSSLAIIALSPLFLLIALAIKLESKGPVIYFSKRAGMGYRVFNFYKFRSMYQDADARLAELEHLNQYADKEGEENCFVKIKNDPRITLVGRFIRKTSLDELPQLFNVLIGDMSLVGNRPLPLYEAEQITRNEWVGRFLAPAGITGLWQVTKRGKDNMSTKERIELDLKYAREISFKKDMEIIFKTFPAMIQHENV